MQVKIEPVMCEEAARYSEKASEVRLELAGEPNGSPYAKVLERAHDAALAGAQTALLAHRLGKCSCHIRAGLNQDRAKRDLPPV